MAKLLLISPSFFSTGGIQNLMKSIVNHSRHQFDVVVRSCECDAIERDKWNGQIIPLDVSGGKHHTKMAQLLLAGRWDYDTVYISSIRHVDAAIIPCLFGKKVVCHAHGNDLFIGQYSSSLNQKVLRYGLKCVSDFIAVSEWTKQYLRKLNVKDKLIHFIPNGVDCCHFNTKKVNRLRYHLGLSKSKFLLLTVARLVPRKGHELVIKTLPHFKNTYYLIVGKGPEQERLKQLAKKEKVIDRVIFTGYITDEKLPAYYDACDLYVMPSLHLNKTGSIEGFGLSFLEANAAGKASIGARTGGISSAVKHEQTGLLCQPNIDSFRLALKRLINDRKLRKNFEKNAFDWAQSHEWPRIVDQIDHVIAE